MKFWFNKKSSDDSAIREAIPVPASAAASAAVPAPAAAPADAASGAPVQPETAPFTITPAPLSAGREKQQIPNERRDLYYQLMNALYDATLVLDENGHIVDCNERTESVLDYTKDDIWDMPIAKVIPAINPLDALSTYPSTPVI